MGCRASGRLEYRPWFLARSVGVSLRHLVLRHVTVFSPGGNTAFDFGGCALEGLGLMV